MREQASERPSGPYRYVVVSLLALVYALNFMDRQIVAVLQEPIRAEFGLRDSQLGLLTGLAFALFYTSFGLPVAWFADRHRRVPIIAAACATWSVFTIACGLARTFPQLLLSRIMVGAGEAGGSAPSYSLISDYFVPGERARALSIYALGVPVGSALGTAIGAWVAAHYGWRTAFYAVGAPGIVVALITLLTVREPARGGLDADAVPEEPVSLAASLRAYLADPATVLVTAASAASAFVGYAVLAWLPSLLVRVKGMSMTELGTYYGAVLGLTGLLGILASGWLADGLARFSRGWYGWLPAIGTLVSIPGLAAAIVAPDWASALGWLTLPALLLNLYVAPSIAIVQDRTPARRRTVAAAVLVFVTTLSGLGGGPLYVGAVSDLARPVWGDGSLKIGLAALLPVMALAAVLHALVARNLARAERVPAPRGETL